MSESSSELKAKQSFVMVRFNEFGSIMMDVQMENVAPLQIIALAQYLEVMGKNALLFQEAQRAEREAEQHITVPKPKIVTAKH